MVIFLFLKTITENASERFVICTELKRTDSLICSRATDILFCYFSNKTQLFKWVNWLLLSFLCL